MVLLIVFDEYANRLLVKNQIKNIAGISSIIESQSAEDALCLVLEKKPDIIISSDSLVNRSGFDLANLLRVNKIEIPVIILSSDSAKAVDAIKGRIFDFLVYPFGSDKLVNSVKKAMVEIENRENVKAAKTKVNKIAITSTTGFSLENIDEIAYCKAEGTYTKLSFVNGSQEITCHNLGKLEKIFRDYDFVRINRSTIINLKRIRSINLKKETILVESKPDIVRFKVSKSFLGNLSVNDLV